MKRLIEYPFIVFFIFFSKEITSRAQGVYRWNIKTATDAQAYLINSTPVKTNIGILSHLERPGKKNKGNFRSPAEMVKVVIPATIIGVGEEEDGDYHLIIISPDRKDTMIAEIPNPDLPPVNQFSNLQKDFSEARTFIQLYLTSQLGRVHYVLKPINVFITGLIFFDKLAHGKGHATNGVELHPVFSISFLPSKINQE